MVARPGCMRLPAAGRAPVRVLQRCSLLGPRHTVMRERRQKDRATLKKAAPQYWGVGAAAGGSADIELIVRIRPGDGLAPAAVAVADGGAVQVGGKSFHYQSSVVCGSNQTVAFVSCACCVCR